MIYKSKKRNDFFYSAPLKSYIYKGNAITFDQAEKLKHKWAKKDLIDNAKNDEDLTPLKLDVFCAFVENISARELTKKSQALTYHSLKRYTECIFNYYSVSRKSCPLRKAKRPHPSPSLEREENPWFHGGRVNGVYFYKGVAYKGGKEETALYKKITIFELAKYASKDDSLAVFANSTGLPLFSEFVEVAHKNNDLKDEILNVYDYIKNLIFIVEGLFDLQIKPEIVIKVELDRLTGIARFRLGTS